MIESSKKPKAVATGTLAHISINADCYVLSNGVRVLSQRGIMRALAPQSGAPGTKDFGRSLERIPNKPAELSSPPIEFELPQGGTCALGRPAEWFVLLLKAYKSAWRSGMLKHSQVRVAELADSLLDALAGVGISALIDEATGYEHVRATGDLARLFDRLLLSQSARWSKMWPEPVVESLCRTYRIRKNGPGVPAPLLGVIGVIYRVVLGADVHDEVKRRNPRGNEREMHHQFFQKDLRRLVSDDLNVIKVLSDQSRDKNEFKARLLAHYRGAGLQLSLAEAS